MPQNRIIDIKKSESSPTEPVTLQQAKDQCIITYSDDDVLLTSLMTKARKIIENFCHISIVAKTITLTADLYNEWELPYGPVTGIQSVQTRTSTQGSGIPTYETAEDSWNQEGEEFLTFVPAKCEKNRYKIIYTAGNYAPDDLCQAILMQVQWLYEHRGEEMDADICPAAEALATPYIRMLWM